MKKYELKDKQFGRWTVLRDAGVDKLHHRRWGCICQCGTKRTVTTSRLVSGYSKSCGCLSAELARERQILPKGKAAFNATYKSYQRQAKRRGKSFDIPKDKFRDLTSSDCYYCGSPPFSLYWLEHMNGTYKYNGLDRVDNTVGYFIYNVVPCCRPCNVMKQDMSQGEFVSHIKKILIHWIRGP